MKMTIEINYNFKFDDHSHEDFNLHLDSETLEVINRANDVLPEWTQLENHQCSHCPLNNIDHKYCPVAISLASVIDRFNNVVSFDELELEVITSTRCVNQRTTAQKALSSLLGLLFATSGCPYTNFFKPMARFHLPLSTEEDTIFRSAGMYLLAQYFLKQEGKESDLEMAGLIKIYDDLHLLNTHIAARIRKASKMDSSVNAVILLDTFTNLMPFVIDEKLNDIRYLFDAYIQSSAD